MGRVKPQKLAQRRNRSFVSKQLIAATSKPTLQQTKPRKRHQYRFRHRPRPLREADRQELARIAEETVAISQGDGSYIDAKSGLTHNIAYQLSASKEKTCIYASSSTGLIDNWQDGPRLLTLPPGHQTQIKFLQVSPLRGAHDLAQSLQDAKDSGGIGFLNCCSAKRPGGGFLNGGTEQEECLARASTLYASLFSDTAAPFYRAHRHDDAAGFYDHQLIYTPHVVVIRRDRRPGDQTETGGGQLVPPFHMSVVSSCAINAQQLRRLYQHNVSKREINQGMEDVMRARMARILRVFEERGIRNLLLGAFGVGQPFHNNVETIARIWAELLACHGAVFKHVFQRVWFAVDMTQFQFQQRFKRAFETRVFEEELTVALTTEEGDGEDWEPVS